MPAHRLEGCSARHHAKRTRRGSRPYPRPGSRSRPLPAQAALRDRGHGRTGDARRFAGWRIDLASYELLDPEGVLVDFAEGEFKVLRAFVEHPRRVLSRDKLLDHVRGPDSDSYDRAIDVQVSRLRRKLRSSGDEMIRTVRNEGDVLVHEVVSAMKDAATVGRKAAGRLLFLRIFAILLGSWRFRR